LSIEIVTIVHFLSLVRLVSKEANVNWELIATHESSYLRWLPWLCQNRKEATAEEIELRELEKKVAVLKSIKPTTTATKSPKMNPAAVDVDKKDPPKAKKKKTHAEIMAELNLKDESGGEHEDIGGGQSRRPNRSQSSGKKTHAEIMAEILAAESTSSNGVEGKAPQQQRARPDKEQGNGNSFDPSSLLQTEFTSQVKARFQNQFNSLNAPIIEPKWKQELRRKRDSQKDEAKLQADVAAQAENAC
jgi:hypothetical protein